MKKVEYTCNLCRDVKHKVDLKAFYWKGDILPQRFVLVDNVDSCDVHLCKDCIKIVKDS